VPERESRLLSEAKHWVFPTSLNFHVFRDTQCPPDNRGLRLFDQTLIIFSANSALKFFLPKKHILKVKNQAKNIF